MKAASFIFSISFIGLTGPVHAAPKYLGSTAHESVANKDVHFSVKETVIELLVDNPEAKTVIDRHLPGLTSSGMIGLIGGLTLEDLQPFIPSFVTAEKLSAIQNDFEKF